MSWRDMGARLGAATLALALSPCLYAAPAPAQGLPGEQGSRNVHVLSHVPLGGALPLAGQTDLFGVD